MIQNINEYYLCILIVESFEEGVEQLVSIVDTLGVFTHDPHLEEIDKIYIILIVVIMSKLVCSRISNPL